MGLKAHRYTGPLELVIYIAGEEPKSQRLPSDGTVRIGRDSHNDVEIPDASVSRHHALLHIGPQIYIEDRSSCNGTEVYKPGKHSGTDTTIANRPEHGRSFPVDIGDRIKLGSVILVVRGAQLKNEKGTSGPRMWTESPTISDPIMEALYEDVRQAARASRAVSILIYGETGAGKERVARFVHDESPRKSRPFVAVNCTQFSQSLVESALFGHKRGAFTGADSDKNGFFQTADSGTIFLDEIADLPLETQAKLLRVLDSGEVYPVGATTPTYVDLRVVAATNKNLLACVRQGTFREDLYHRLKGFEYEVPPLRDRPKDILALADRFLADLCRHDNHPNIFRFSEAAVACLLSYPFPGNVRELKIAVDIASVRCSPSTLILPKHLPAEIANKAPTKVEVPKMPNLPAESDDEKARIIRTLAKYGGNQKAAAAELGWCNRTLVNKLNRYPDIPRPKKKRGPREMPPTKPITVNNGHSFEGWTGGDI